MFKLKDRSTTFWDVDDTLVLWGMDQETTALPIQDPQGWWYKLVPHEKHIEILKKNKEDGNINIIWSQGGSDWAEAVIRALKLEEYVDAIITKPIRYVDDLPCEDWMGSRIYYKTYLKEDTTKKIK